MQGAPARGKAQGPALDSLLRIDEAADALACALASSDGALDGRGREGSQERFVLPERVDAVRFDKPATLQQTHDALSGGFGVVPHAGVGQWRCRYEDGVAAGAGDKDTLGHEHVKVRIDVEGRA